MPAGTGAPAATSPLRLEFGAANLPQSSTTAAGAATATTTAVRPLETVEPQ